MFVLSVQNFFLIGGLVTIGYFCLEFEHLAFISLGCGGEQGFCNYDFLFSTFIRILFVSCVW